MPNGTPSPRSPKLLIDILENFEVVILAVITVLLIFSIGIRICFVNPLFGGKGIYPLATV